jgi:prolipoprotein diacylglyceryltransferase
MIDIRLFGLLLTVLVVSAILIVWVRFSRTSKWKISLQEVMDLALSGVVPGFLGVRLICGAFDKYEDLQKLVGLDGVLAIALGGLASLWFGISKIHELAVKRPS